METFRKVIIKTADDLPKENGNYPCHCKGYVDDDLNYVTGLNFIRQNGDEEWFLENVAWYLIPVDETKERERIIKVLEKYDIDRVS